MGRLEIHRTIAAAVAAAAVTEAFGERPAGLGVAEELAASTVALEFAGQDTLKTFANRDLSKDTLAMPQDCLILEPAPCQVESLSETFAAVAVVAAEIVAAVAGDNAAVAGTVDVVGFGDVAVVAGAVAPAQCHLRNIFDHPSRYLSPARLHVGTSAALRSSPPPHAPGTCPGSLYLSVHRSRGARRDRSLLSFPTKFDSLLSSSSLLYLFLLFQSSLSFSFVHMHSI